MFASASPDSIKQWKCPEGKFIQNMAGHNAIINCLAVTHDDVLVSGGDNGTLHFWDFKTGYNFQRLQVRTLRLIQEYLSAIDLNCLLFAFLDKSASHKVVFV